MISLDPTTRVAAHVLGELNESISRLRRRILIEVRYRWFRLTGRDRWVPPETPREHASEEEELMVIADAAGIDIPPSADDPRQCSHAWGFALNPDIVPAWLIDGTQGKIQAPEVPDLPQVLRTDGYIDWPSLLAEHTDQLEIVHDWTPTSRCLEIVEELRDRGLDASITAQVYLRRRDSAGLVFGLEAAAIVLNDDSAEDILQACEVDLREAMTIVPEEQRAHLMFGSADFRRDGAVSWDFC